TGRRATATSVERQLGVTYATFYRDFPDLIEWFKGQLAAWRDKAGAEKDTAKREDDLARLRRENTDLHKQARIYAEAIRQLTLGKAILEDISRASRGAPTSMIGVVSTMHQRTTDKIERPS
ncbi:hypothetical protein, partial [Streptomyces sp. NPDC127084]|uniref:hypothetical protein n=1 Tax=Streptomyces sp. NPDC127084 TaxID=3347133 RepID=UPI0036660E34